MGIVPRQGGVVPARLRGSGASRKSSHPSRTGWSDDAADATAAAFAKRRVDATADATSYVSFVGATATAANDATAGWWSSCARHAASATAAVPPGGRRPSASVGRPSSSIRVVSSCRSLCRVGQHGREAAPHRGSGGVRGGASSGGGCRWWWCSVRRATSSSPTFFVVHGWFFSASGGRPSASTGSDRGGVGTDGSARRREESRRRGRQCHCHAVRFSCTDADHQPQRISRSTAIADRSNAVARYCHWYGQSVADIAGRSTPRGGLCPGSDQPYP